ncbi:uncharacterized protein LOC114737844 isoform X2 [Neltuma alba]|uniref:uncharacterized protein LOC114737844 isoform X2 n=1 Tax=Neltuma alba TaxID=207710 RepID=UPI0010A48452|nr:uncharacterized protein LOC114737844 isoform X2 [Prosopis alba]
MRASHQQTKMGFCGSSDTDSITTSTDRNEVVGVNFDDTLPFDSQLSPSSVSGVNDDIGMDNDWRYLENTVPFDDDAPVYDDALETQPVDLAGETQVLDDIDDEEDNNTQLLDVVDGKVSIDSHGDRTNGTGILENVREPSSDYRQCIAGAQSADSKQISCEPRSRPGEKKLLEKTDPVINQQTSSGSVPPRFTSVRVESLREAALAARNMNLKQNEDGINPITGTSQPQEPLSVTNNGEPFLGCTEKTREYDHGEHRGEANGDFHKDKSRIASSVVRKLFNDDLPAEKEGCPYNNNDVGGEESLTKLSICDDGCAGLSYVDSQEPGELTQAAALDVVDRLLKENDVLECDQEADFVNKVQESLKSLPSLKGHQSLAKRVYGSGNAGKTGVYDWDDSREDDGGGDIFLRRKDEFLEAMPRQKSLPAVQKIKASRADGSYNNDGGQSTYNKRMREVQSDSRLVLHSLKVRDGTVKEAAKEPKRNLVSDLDELFNINYSGAQLEPNDTAADAQGMLDVGLDTQMAAEAMEALVNYEGGDTRVANEAARSSLADQPNNSCPGTKKAITSKKCSEKNDRIQKRVKSDLQNSSLLKAHNEEAGEQCKRKKLTKRLKRSMLNVEDGLISCASENSGKFRSQLVGQRKSARASKRHKGNELHDCIGSKGENGGSLVSKRHLQSQVFHFSPVARRTRRSLVANQLKPDRPSRSHTEEDGRVDSLEKNSSSVVFQASKNLDPKAKQSCSARFEDNGNTRLSADNDGTKSDALDHPRRRSLRKLSSHDEGSERLVGSSNSSVQSEDVGLSAARKRKMKTSDSPRESFKLSDLTSATPDKCRTPVNDASPVCMGDNYYKKSCNRELRRELCSLSASGLEFTPSKDSRKRRDMTGIRILYSQHVDEDIIKHQKKILSRLGVSVVTSILDATHFIANKFVRTRNMLEAIASGKPVVTHLWIESCGQTNCLIDEKNYILRDAKKEKEFGFSMSVSLARAIRHPLLEGRKVLITPNTKPSKEIVSHLVKAVQGQAVERIGRSSLKDDKIQDDLLILSCEDDYALCVPFLEKGTAVYSSELLLNGIVTQKLEYERHRLFADNVKKTRSTIWLKDGGTYRAVNKCK